MNHYCLRGVWLQDSNDLGSSIIIRSLFVIFIHQNLVNDIFAHITMTVTKSVCVCLFSVNNFHFMVNIFHINLLIHCTYY